MTTVMTDEAVVPTIRQAPTPPKRERRGSTLPKQIDWTYDLNMSAKSKRIDVGDKIEVVYFDGTKHPELAGRQGFVSYRQKDNTLIIEIEGGGGTYKAHQLWWKRSEL